MNVLEEDLHEINSLPLVTKISKGRVNVKELLVKAAYDKDYNLESRSDEEDETDPVLVLEYADDVYVYENALGATYACFMTAGRFRYFTRVTVGVEVVITEEGIANV